MQMPGCIYNLMDFKITQIKQTLIYIQILYAIHIEIQSRRERKTFTVIPQLTQSPIEF